MFGRFVAAILFAAFSAAAPAQTTETTANLITNQPGISGTGVWTGIGGYSQLNGQHPTTLWGCCTSYSGSAPFLDTSTTNGNGQSGQIIWSYGQSTVQQIIAINQALMGVGAGIQISGYNWGYDVRNMNGYSTQGGIDTLTATTFMTNSAGVTILSDTRTYNTQMDWTRFSGTVAAATPVDLANAGNVGVSFSSRDAGFWAGYYGPQVRDVSLSLNYTATPVDPCVANPQSSPSCPGYRTYYNMTDDGYAIVNLPFVFPFYGQTFTTSVMYTNGVVGFLNPNAGGFCCDGTDLNGQIGNANSPWNYAIYALNTDLYPGANSLFYTQQTDGGTGLKYTWENVIEIGTNNENTFHVNIKDSGFIGINYEKVNLSGWRHPLIGIAGNISAGQYYQQYYGQASSMPATAGTAYTFTGTETTDICSINPLYNPSCPGYAAAYFTQQCSINALYDPQCPGYAAAYLTYQCNANALYSPSCPGYAQAYFDQQCSLDPLYNSSCPGYQQAYFTQQCALDGLYDTTCPNYADAYYVQQCTADPLYDSGCTGYAEAYALKYVIPTNPTTSTDTTTVIASATVSDPVASAAPLVADPVVNQTITTTSTSTSPATAATATVPLVATPAATTTTTVATSTSASEKKEETSTTETTSTSDSSSSTTTSTASSSDSKDKPQTTRQALAERRMAAARAKAVEEGKQLANKMGEAATLEAQVAVQNVVVQAMGFTPGFDAYSRAALPDVPGYKPFEIYPGQRNIDNPQGRRFMTGSDRLHAEMVDQQYGDAR